jgi:ABC-2 type transport system permease protein
MSGGTEPRDRAAEAGEAVVADVVRVIVSGRDRPRPASASVAARMFCWRALLKIKHVPEQLMDVTLTPVMFILMFTYLFGGAIAGSTREYLQYLTPGVLVMTVLFTTVYSGVNLCTDISKGVFDRFRSLPIWRPAPLVGALLGDLLRYVLAGLVTIAVGLALGFRPAGGVVGVLLGLGLLLVFASGLAWAFTVLGILMKTPSAMLNLGFLLLFPLTFASNVFVAPTTMPAWLERAVGANPVTFLVSATRGLMAGETPTRDIGLVFASAAALTVVFAPIAARLYRTRG